MPGGEQGAGEGGCQPCSTGADPAAGAPSLGRARCGAEPGAAEPGADGAEPGADGAEPGAGAAGAELSAAAGAEPRWLPPRSRGRGTYAPPSIPSRRRRGSPGKFLAAESGAEPAAPWGSPGKGKGDPAAGEALPRASPGGTRCPRASPALGVGRTRSPWVSPGAGGQGAQPRRLCPRGWERHTPPGGDGAVGSASPGCDLCPPPGQPRAPGCVCEGHISLRALGCACAWSCTPSQGGLQECGVAHRGRQKADLFCLKPMGMGNPGRGKLCNPQSDFGRGLGAAFPYTALCPSDTEQSLSYALLLL